MAKRELSSTLKNLKFMQRAAQRDEKPKKEEEVIPSGDSPASFKRCVVIVDGDPPPGATRGRMSFLSFNPSIDKLNTEASSLNETESTSTSSGRQNEAIPTRENRCSQDVLDNSELDSSTNEAKGHLKRKPTEAASEPDHPYKPTKNDEDNRDSSSARSRSSKKREKLDWSVLRPPKYQSKRN